jgi:transposase
MADLRDEWRTLNARIEALDGEFVDLVPRDDAALRLTSILGAGVLNAFALVATVGNAMASTRRGILGLARPRAPAAYNRR